MTNRTAPVGSPDWSGCATMDGLNSAAASRAYSLLKVAPTSRRRAGDSVRLRRRRGAPPAGSGRPRSRRGRGVGSRTSTGCDPGCRRPRCRIAPGPARARPTNATPPRPDDLLAGQERPTDHSRRVRAQDAVDATDQLPRWQSGQRLASAAVRSPSCRVDRVARVDSALVRRSPDQDAVRPDLHRSWVVEDDADVVGPGEPSDARSGEATGRRQSAHTPASTPRPAPRGLDRLLVEAGRGSPATQPPTG